MSRIATRLYSSSNTREWSNATVSTAHDWLESECNMLFTSYRTVPHRLRTNLVLVFCVAITQVCCHTGVQGVEPDVATDPSALVVAPGFDVERLYSVPKETQGSWVSLTTGPHGSLYACDQYGALFQIDVSTSPVSVERLEVEIGEAQGLLYAFDSLYVVVNRGGRFASGLYRVRDANGDGTLDHVEQLKAFDGGSEHGPHGVIKTADGQGLYVVAGNKTKLPADIARYRLPANWAEDQLLLREPCSNNHNTGVLAPGGWVCRTDPDGRRWELVAAGFRNAYDLALNRDGELFTYDADMEMDVGLPWYRPTRVCHVVSGAEFGWRYGTGKWPSYFPDSLPAVVDVGLGSPTGICFCHEANFPTTYQNALLIADWTYGRIFAVHMTPAGASYTGQLESFISGTPLPVTDMEVNGYDGALYFTIGGRRTQSGLYRVTYVGTGSSTDDSRTPDFALEDSLRRMRRELEALHTSEQTAGAGGLVRESLGHEDRHIRYSARIALEHQSVAVQRQVLDSLVHPRAIIHAALAVARSTNDDRSILSRLRQIDWHQLPTNDQVDLLRTLGVVFARQGEPPASERDFWIARLEDCYPSAAENQALNHELCRMLLYLKSDKVIEPSLEQLTAVTGQEDRLFYAHHMRTASHGWNIDQRRRYFALLNELETKTLVGDFTGGGHLQIFIRRMRDHSVDATPREWLPELDDVIHANIADADKSGSPTPRKFVRNWQVDELVSALRQPLRGRSWDSGMKLYVAAECLRCHRFDNRGGVLGPDLTGVAKRYDRSVLLRELIEPSAQVSDQFQTYRLTTEDGREFEGRILEESPKQIVMATNPLDPAARVTVRTDQVESRAPSRQSMMPTGLLNTLTIEEIKDLIAFLESGGDKDHPAFR